MTKSFLVLAAIFILVGGGIGGAFTGGVILGRSQVENEAPTTANLTPPQDFSGQAAALRQFADQIPLDDEGNPDFAALRRMAQAQGGGLPTPPGRTPTASTAVDSDETASAENTDEEVGSEDAGGESTLPSFGRGLGAFGGGATFGSIESISDGVVVINAPQGRVEVAIDSETAIQVFSTGELSDLKEGMNVTAMGEFDAESGKLDAVTIIAAQEGADAFPGLGGGFLNRPQGARGL